MPDRLLLSCYLRGFHSLRMLGFWEKLLQLYPYSRLTKRPVYLRVLALDTTEPPLFERAWEPPFSPAQAIELSREFQHEDGAWQLDCEWDLMEQQDANWKLAPVPVSLWCFGPRFENELQDHLRVELGLEQRFLPKPGDEASARAAQANLRSLTRLVHDIEKQLPVERRHLWSESGENFAERLQRMAEESGLTGRPS